MVGVSDVIKAGPGTCRLAWVALSAGPHAGPWAAAKIRTFRLRMSRPRRPGQKVGPDHVLEDEDVLRIILKK